MGEVVEHDARESLDELIGCWNSWDSNEVYYLTALVPAIVRGTAHLSTDKEKSIIRRLREILSAEEWERLPELIAGRRVELDASHKRQKAEQERERERKRQEEGDLRARHAERERTRQAREAEREGTRQAQEAEGGRKRRAYEAERERERQEEADRSARKQEFINRVRFALESEFLSADERLEQDPDLGLLSATAYLELKSEFVQERAVRELHQPLDAQQARAVAATGGDIQVVARAGAGKTRTLVARALFLQKHCGVSPRDLLLLAFNKAAAAEMRERLKDVLDGDVPHVMTFHALAHALVHPEEQLTYDEPKAGNLGLSRAIQGVIDEHLRSEKYRPLICDLMLAHFREDWERIVKGGFDLPVKELIKYRRALPRETLRGEYVKSFGERLIANTLFEHGIEYKYERNFRWNGVNYKPDFSIPRHGGGVVIEYFGLSGDADYDLMSLEKRKFWKRQGGWTLLEFSPKDIISRGVEGFVGLLLERLRGADVTGNRLSDEDVWRLIKPRAIGEFTGAVKSFVSRCRKRNLGADDLHRIISQHAPITTAEELFLTVAASVYSGYVDGLRSSQEEDFDGLMWRAIARLEDGKSRFARDKGRERGDLRSMRFVLIDEFQDFSEMFYRLSQGIRSLNPRVEFFCVGDDWQAINGFAGSDSRFFKNFKSLFRSTTTLEVTTNYRSPIEVVQVGNALMNGQGSPAMPHLSDTGYVRTARLSKFVPSGPEGQRHSGDEATPAVLRLVKRLLESCGDVVMLARRNAPPWYVNYGRDVPGSRPGLEAFAEHIRSFLPEEDRHRVTASTAHRYKGLEKKAVIVLDADEGSYPLIHPNWIFLRVFGDSVERIEAEERRLFYVALTRSKHSLVILSDGSRGESPYLTEIRKLMTLNAIAWPDLEPVAALDGVRLEVRVRCAYNPAGNGLLKAQGYRWNGVDKYWYRTVPAEGFTMAALCAEPWANGDVSIEVYSESGKLIERR